MRALALTAVLLSLAASPAWCDAPVATSPADSAAPAMPQAVPPPIGADAGGDSDTVVAVNGCGEPRASSSDTGAAPDTAVHGQVDVAMGSNGYRSVHAAGCKPIGDNGYVGVSVGVGSYEGGHRR